MGLAVYRALRLIQKWQHLGILEVKDVTRRAGRPIRRYGLSAPHFFIPALLLPYEEVLALVSQPMEQQMRRELGHVLVDLVGLQGTQVFLEPQRYGAYLVKQPGELWDGEAPGSPALTERWLTLRLDYSEACALRDELDELLTRYAQRQGSQVYQLHQRLVPFRSS